MNLLRAMFAPAFKMPPKSCVSNGGSGGGDSAAARAALRVCKALVPTEKGGYSYGSRKPHLDVRVFV